MPLTSRRTRPARARHPGRPVGHPEVQPSAGRCRLLAVAAAVLLCAAVPAGADDAAAGEPPADVAPPPSIAGGDLVFREGRGMFSRFFSRLGGYRLPWSHAGILVFEDERPFVIHTEANEFTGVGRARMQPLAEFVGEDNARSHAFFRVRGLDAATRRAVIERARAWVRARVPFDDDFDLATDDRLYCTELIHKAFRMAGAGLIDRPETLRTPGLVVSPRVRAVTVGQLVESERVVKEQW